MIPMQVLFASDDGNAAGRAWRRPAGIALLAVSFSAWLYAMAIALATGRADNVLLLLILATTTAEVRDSLASGNPWSWRRAALFSLTVLVGLVAVARGHSLFGWTCVAAAGIGALIPVLMKRDA